ncbi:MAG: hypothetical protein GY699_05910 [Desulfobacteraceae bacterium]|nr:hypothetical protein [Desulfobacteraceae bacterium]
MILRLPLIVGAFYLVFALPVIFRLSENIHGLYGMLFWSFNFLTIFIFGNSGVIDKIELFIFNEKSQYTSDLTLVGISLIFMLVLSILIGAAIDRKDH